MAMHEIKKSCKIMNEMLMYLMKNGQRNIDLKIEYTDDMSLFTFTVEELPSKVICQLAENLNKGRKYEFEGYYWELMGESDSSNELEIIGMLVDGITITEKDTKTELIVRRKH